MERRIQNTQVKMKSGSRLGSVVAIGKKCMDTVVNLLFPRHCPVCDKIVTPLGERICTQCIPKLPPLAPPWCMKCGKKLLEEGVYCKDCEEQEHEYVAGRSVFAYTGASLPIYRFKYGKRAEYAEYFGEMAARYLEDFLVRVRPDVLVPIPLHSAKLAARGYNQAELFAKALGKHCGVPVDCKLLKRVKNTVPMKVLAPSERQKNVKNSFIVRRNAIQLKTIVIIDDIYTTGATINEAARVLKAAGAGEIYFITLASGTGV